MIGWLIRLTGLRAWLRDAVVALLFLLAWLNLHAFAAVFETAPGASVWYPARGLSLALLLIGGWRFVPVLLLASLLGGRAYHLPDHPGTWMGAAAWITGCMAVCAGWLRHSGVLQADGKLSDAVRLLAALLLSACAVAVGVVACNVQAGLLPASLQTEVTFQFAVGDGIGLLIVVPLALQCQRWVLTRPMWSPRQAGRAALDAGLIVVMAVVLLWLDIGDGGDSPTARVRWYLMLLPLAVSAVRFGMPGAAIAALALSLGIVAAVRQYPGVVSPLDLQLLLLTLSVLSVLLGTAVDERHRAQAALTALRAAQTRQARQEAEAARRSKARFLAATAHDLRPPFEALRLGLEALALRPSSPCEPDAGEVLARTTRAMHSLGRVLDQVLDVARLDGELGQAMPQVFAVQPVLTQLVQEATAGLHVPVRLRCGDWQVIGDPVLFERVMRNLVGNAAQASVDQGRVLVAARRRGSALQVRVLDRGVGMDAPQLAQAFDAFVSHRPGGWGIGLSLVREIADDLGLALRVHSTLGVGTAVCLSLPLAQHSLPVGAATQPWRDRVIGLALRHRVRRDWLAAVLADRGAAVVSAASVPALQQELYVLGARPQLLVVDDAAAALTESTWARVPRLAVDPFSEPDLPALLERLTAAMNVPAP